MKTFNGHKHNVIQRYWYEHECKSIQCSTRSMYKCASLIIDINVRVRYSQHLNAVYVFLHGFTIISQQRHEERTTSHSNVVNTWVQNNINSNGNAFWILRFLCAILICISQNGITQSQRYENSQIYIIEAKTSYQMLVHLFIKIISFLT